MSDDPSGGQPNYSFEGGRSEPRAERFELHMFHHVHPDPRMDQVLALLQRIIETQESIMASLADIATAETAEGAAIQAIMADMASLQTQLTAAQADGDPALTAALPPAATPAPTPVPTAAPDPAPAA